MTEYEAASLALQETMIWATLAGPIVAAIVGGIQCGLIYYGIRAMKDSTKSREPILEALRDQSAGIRALLERTSERNP